MAHPDGSAPHNLSYIDRVRSDLFRFGFYAAMRTLECAHPDKPRFGRSERPAHDPVRLGQAPTLAFAPTELASFSPGEDGTPPLLSVYFFGLFGPNGPLPLHLTEHAVSRALHERDHTLRRFADLFHHRLLMFFYRAWASAEPVVGFDRPDSDRFAAYVATLIGLGMPSLLGRDAAPDLVKLFHAGNLAGQSQHPDGLRNLLADYFGVPVRIEEFVGDWLEIPVENQMSLGTSKNTGLLGETALIGSWVWSRAHKFRVDVGALGFDDFVRFLPGRPAVEKLAALVRTYVGDELGFELGVVLAGEAVPPLELGGAAWLGWTTWLGERPGAQDADDLRFDPMMQ